MNNKLLGESLLGCLMIDNQIIKHIEPLITGKHFTNFADREIYKAITSSIKQGEIVDLVTLETVLDGVNTGVTCPIAYLGQMMKDVNSVSMVGVYARQLAENIKEEEYQTLIKRAGVGDEVARVMLKDFDHSIEKYPDVIPFCDEPPKVQQITSDMLPIELMRYVENTSLRMDDQPKDFAAVSSLVAAASLIGGRAVIQPKVNDDGWHIPITLWGALIGNPSSKKTPVAKASIRLLNKIKSDVYDPAYKDALLDYRADIEVQKLAFDAAKKQAKAELKKGNQQAAKDALRAEFDSEAEEPKERQLVVNDVTMEKMVELLSDNPMGLLLFRDELSGWLSRMESEEYAHERAFWLECFEGLNNSYVQDRIGAGQRKTKHTLVSILGGVQPSKLLPLLNSRSKGMGNDGLFERFQFAVWPEKSCSYKDVAVDDEAKETAFGFLSKLSDLPETDEPIIFTFASEAQDVYTQWSTNWLNKVVSLPDDLQAVFGKWNALAAKLALLFHLASGIKLEAQTPVTLIALNMALKWIGYLESHQMKIRAFSTNPNHSAEHLLGKIPALLDQLNRNYFTKSDIRNRTWSGLETQEKRNDAINKLLAHHYILENKVQAGTKTTTHYKLNKKI